ncbi:hypothetical protein D1823_15985 [Ruegeria sp. AD91A]|nr:hypothetical protein D1823_15985 [Ruegeria sp. AD91A]
MTSLLPVSDAGSRGNALPASGWVYCSDNTDACQRVEKVGFAEFVFKDAVILSRLARPGEDTRPRFFWPLNSLKTRNLCRRISLIWRLVFTYLR